METLKNLVGILERTLGSAIWKVVGSTFNTRVQSKDI